MIEVRTLSLRIDSPDSKWLAREPGLRNAAYRGAVPEIQPYPELRCGARGRWLAFLYPQRNRHRLFLRDVNQKGKNMHQRLRFLLYLLVVVLVAANAFSDVFSFYDAYYSDGTWTTQVGEHDK